MKLNGKVFVMLSVLMILAIAGSATGVFMLKSADRSSSHVVSRDVDYLSEYNNLLVYGLQRGQAVRNYMLNPKDGRSLDSFYRGASDSHNVLKELIERAPDHGVDPAFLLEIQQKNAENIKLQEKAVNLAVSDFKQAMKVIVEEESASWQDLRNSYLAGRQQVQMMFDQTAADMSRDIQTSIVIVIAMIVLFAISGGAIYWYMNRIITKPIVQASHHVNRIASGDLTVLPLDVKSKDEIGQLGRSVNEMTVELRRLVGEVKATSELLAVSSGSLASISSEANQAGRQVGGVVERLADATESQLRGVEESGRALEEIAQGVQRIAESSGGAAEQAANAAKQAHEGQSAIRDAGKQMDAIRSSVGHTAEEIRTLQARSGEIGEIVNAIKDISTQTQLLALNASIEAARAGDAGRGFAVVAGEVKKLALQSESSAETIDALISGLQEATRRAAEAMELGLADVVQGEVVIGDAKSAFDAILAQTDGVASQIQEISAASEQMSASSEEVTASMEDIARVAKDSSDEAQVAAAATEEQLASMEEIASSASSLNDSAQRLRQLVSRFQY